MQVLLLSVSAHITKQLGMAPGGEFRAAYREVWMTIIKVYKQWHCILFNLFPLDSEVWGVPYFFCNTFFVKTWKYIVIRKYACMRLLKTSVRLTDLFIEYYILCTSKWTCEILKCVCLFVYRLYDFILPSGRPKYAVFLVVSFRILRLVKYWQLFIVRTLCFQSWKCVIR